jgi:Protein of unknown function (DUF3037)
VPALSSFDYAVFRVVPRVERGELINAGVILFCLERDFLQARVELDEARLRALSASICRRSPGSVPATRTRDRSQGFRSGSAFIGSSRRAAQ